MRVFAVKIGGKKVSIFLHLRITANSAGGIGESLSVKWSIKRGCKIFEIDAKFEGVKRDHFE